MSSTSNYTEMSLIKVSESSHVKLQLWFISSMYMVNMVTLTDRYVQYLLL